MENDNKNPAVRTPFALTWFETVLSEKGPARMSTRLAMAAVGSIVRGTGSREVRLSINDLKSRAGMTRTTLMRSLVDAADAGWIQRIPERRFKHKRAWQYYHLTIRLPNELKQMQATSDAIGFAVEQGAAT